MHNHLSDDPTQSQADAQMNKTIIDIAKPLGISVTPPPPEAHPDKAPMQDRRFPASTGRNFARTKAKE
jgi:RadC-like JAB domain